MLQLLEDNLGTSAVSTFPVPPTRHLQDICREQCESGILGGAWCPQRGGQPGCPPQNGKSRGMLRVASLVSAQTG